MKTAILTIIAGIFLLFCNCSKDDNNNTENWAAAVEGTYIGTAIDYDNDTLSATSLISRVNDKLLDFQITITGSAICLDSVVMNSPTTITIGNKDLCSWIAHSSVTGSGNFSGNILNFTLNYSGTGIPVYYTINGTKQ